MNLIKRPISLVLVMLLAGVMAAAAVTLWPEPQSPEMVGTVFPQPRTVPDVELVDHTNSPWNPAELQGGWELVFFGFTHCPDVCPMTLATLAGSLSHLQASGAQVLPKVVFISVDPGRDNPAQLGTYVQHFNEDFVGVTGKQETIDTLTRALGIAYSLGEPDENGDYPVDHSAAILLINPDGRLQALWQPPHGREVIAEEFLRIQSAYVEASRS